MPQLADLADILIKCRVTSKNLWDEAARDRTTVSSILENLAKKAPVWWDGPSPAPPGLTEYQREMIQSRFDENELDLLRRDLALNQFVLLDKLGHGGQGEVYRSRQLNPPRYAAVKVLIRDTEVRRKRFEQEAKAMIRIQHPNVARFYLYERIRNAHGEPTDEYLIAMEFVKGTDLQRVIRKNGPVSWPFAVHWVSDILSGLEVIHQNGFIHRDIKPENTMILGPHPGSGAKWDQTSAKLLDFGAVNRVGEGEPTEEGKPNARVFVGTMEYAAPEQWIGKIVLESDIYALGGTLFFMLTGRNVFKKEKRDAMAYMHSHLRENVPEILEFNQTVPPELNQLYLRMMSKDPEQRGTATELLADFQKLRPREALTSPVTATAAPTFNPSRSKSTSVEPEKPTEVLPIKRLKTRSDETVVDNPLLRAFDPFLSFLERIFIPGHLRAVSGAGLSIPERLIALLRRPLAVATLIIIFIAIIIMIYVII